MTSRETNPRARNSLHTHQPTTNQPLGDTAMQNTTAAVTSAQPGNFIADLHAAAAGREDTEFLIVEGGETITYVEMFERASRYARVLSDAGAMPGDRILVAVDKSVDAVAVYLACLHSGTVHLPINIALTDNEIAYCVDDAEPAVAVVDPTRSGGIGTGITVLTHPGNGEGTLAEAARGAGPIPVTKRADTDPAALLYTSGTTGRRKGVVLTHKSLRLNAGALHSAWHFGPADHLIHCLPLFHVHGLFVALHCAMLSAVPVTFLQRFDPAAVIAAFDRATVFMGVPTHYRRLLDTSNLDRSTCGGMRLFLSGSAPLPEATFAEFAKRSGHVICERYGMTETLIMTSNPYDGERVPGTVGFAVAGVELRITDPEGEICEPGVAGMVEVRSEQTTAGYWKRPELTVQRGGWFPTGDMGSIDDDGRLRLHGRSDDVIISGGENIHPAEIEAVLESVDGIVEAAVFATIDPDLGEAVTAAVVTSAVAPDTTTIRTALDAKLARYKHPKRMICVASLPRNAMGKLNRATLRDCYTTS